MSTKFKLNKLKNNISPAIIDKIFLPVIDVVILRINALNRT